MKFIIVHPDVMNERLIFPGGLAYVASSLLNEGHEVEILDIAANEMTEEETLREIESRDSDAWGIGTVITAYKKAKWLGNKIKEFHPDSKLIFGGPINEGSQFLFKNASADIVVVGEAEHTIKEVAQGVEGKREFEDINGIHFKDSSGIHINPARSRIQNLDELDYPAWQLFDIKNKYTKSIIWTSRSRKSMSVISGRGCPYLCNFCTTGQGREIKFRGVDNIFDEITKLQKLYKVDYLAFFDDNFLVYDKIQKGWLDDFCEHMSSDFPKMKWGVSGKVNLVSPESLKMMSNAGCEVIAYGAESGSDKILKLINKGQLVRHIEDAVVWTREAGMEFYASFQMGALGETKETIRETIDFCKRLGIPQRFFFFTTPLPGTTLYNQMKAEGKITDDEKYLEKLGETGEEGGINNLTINVSELSDEELIQERDNAIKEITEHYMKTHKRQMSTQKIKTFYSYVRQHGIGKALKQTAITIKNREFV